MIMKERQRYLLSQHVATKLLTRQQQAIWLTW